jgi:hypothetical protein
MNGRVAKAIRKYSLIRFQQLAPIYKAKLKMSPRNLYKLFKKLYYEKSRSFNKMVRATI